MSKFMLNGSATSVASVKIKLIWKEVLGSAVGLTTQNRNAAAMRSASSAKSAEESQEHKGALGI